MYQVIDGKGMEIVEFDTMPELPITGLTQGEAAYREMLRVASQPTFLHVGFGVKLAFARITYAEALTKAIETGVITEPGKYGIHLVPGTDNYEIYTIVEK